MTCRSHSESFIKTYSHQEKYSIIQIKNSAHTSVNKFVHNKKLNTLAFHIRKKTMTKYYCKICGYVYDPVEGDPDGGIAPGTSFEDISDDWKCPVCGVGKEEMVAVD